MGVDLAGIKEAACEQISGIGVKCAQVAISIEITIWHLLVFAVLSVVTGLIAHIILRYVNIAGTKWKQALGTKSHENGAVNYPNTIMINSHRMRDMLEVRGLDGLNLKETAKRLNEKYEDEYFLVEFRENGGRLFRKELKIRAGWMKLNFFEFRLDPETLKTLKAKSDSDEDDDTDAKQGAIGEFDLFARGIKPWDFRHWLHHPNREIRIGLWVAMFAATLEFGPDLISSVRTLFETP